MWKIGSLLIAGTVSATLFAKLYCQDARALEVVNSPPQPVYKQRNDLSCRGIRKETVHDRVAVQCSAVQCSAYYYHH
jgi:sulfur transfer complex TusBCD TusB component (DsrH family)